MTEAVGDAVYVFGPDVHGRQRGDGTFYKRGPSQRREGGDGNAGVGGRCPEKTMSPIPRRTLRENSN